MITFAFQEPNLPFVVAILLMFIIAVLEGITTVLGMGLSGFLDSLIPEVDVDIDADIDADMGVAGPDGATGSAFTRLLGWLRIGKVPALILLVVFLTTFGLLGLILQSIVWNLTGTLLPALMASLAALLLALPLVRLFGGILARVIPKDETEAVSESSFIGLVAVITLGTARQGKPAQAKLKDRYGQSHYVMVEPDNDSEAFDQGAEVLLVSQQSSVFKAIQNTSAVLGVSGDG